MQKANKEKYKYEGHQFYLDKHIGKQVCWQCGLIGLRNKATDWCVAKGCNYKDDPSYQKKMKELTKKFNF